MEQAAGKPRITDHPFFKRRGRIVFTLLAVLAFIGLAPLATVAWKLIDINREALVTAQQEYQSLMATSVAHELDIHIEGQRSQVLRVAQTLGAAIGRGGYAQSDQLRRVLEDVQGERMLYLRYTYFRSQDARSISAGQLDANLDPVFESGLEEAVQILSRTAQDGGEETIVSRPILLETRPRRAALVISAPVISGTRFRGVLSALVDLSPVWQSVVERNQSGHLIFALDEAGRVIASNAPARVVPGTDVSRSPMVVRFLKADGRAEETLPFVELDDGAEQAYIGSYKTTGLGWGVFVQARLQDVYAPVNRMVDSITSRALLVIGLAVVAAIIFARTLSNPIKRLAAASRAFAAGDFSTRVEVRSGNELGELGFTFNTMAEEIESQIRQLKRAAEENKELFLGTIRALAQAIDAKDPYTRGHSARVNRYSVVLARQLGMSDEDVADIHVASLMHDVGKIGINDSILQKPGKLTADEFEVMKTHTTKGAQIMAPIRQMQRVIPGLRSHHERWEGGGYPDGLTGAKIPFMARLIAVADAFDAMTTHRPYQTAMSFPKALERLNVLKGVAFDERIVEAFNRAYRRGLIVPDPDPAVVENSDRRAPAATPPVVA
ncbi:MAG TPA: HD domain-containing phosphohydrolase [Candidatus Polarisedimenticolaceae bacterium]|nr:HD domain-containing phosphohydrolase [Candidatus Polarisedimenticolaceae bacterium]